MEQKSIRVQVSEAWAGPYDPNEKFRYGAVVQDETGLSIYRSRRSNNQGHPLTDTLWWKLIINLSYIKRVADGIIELDDTMSRKETERQEAEEERETNEQTRERTFTTNEGSEAGSSPADGSRWGRFLHNEEKRQDDAEAAEGSQEQSEPNDGTRWGAFLAAEVLRDQARRLAEGTEAESIANDGTRWGAYLAAEALRNQARQLVEGTAGSQANDGTRWGAFLAAEVLRDQARQLAEGTAESQADDGTRWGAYLAAEALRNQARLLTEGTAESQANDGTRWGAYLAAEALRNQARLLAEGTAESQPNDGTRWGAFLAAEAARAEIAAALRTMIENGVVVPAVAKTLSAFAERNTLSVEDTWYGAVRTTGGEESIDSRQKAQLVAVVAREKFYASALRFTGYNLLRNAIAIGSGYYFLVPAMAFGTFGTANEPNGILFTNGNHENLKPTVRFKALSAGVPTSVSDGAACSYTDSNGYRFFTTPEAGWMIVDGITYSNTCAKIAWSERYDEFVAPDAAGDAGSVISIAPIIHKIHSYDLMLAVGGIGDGFEVTSLMPPQATWRRRCDRVKPTWTTVAGEDGTYVHSAAIDAIRPDGAAQLEDKTPLSVVGTTVSYSDDQPEATNQYVEYQLATVVTGTETISPLGDVEDWGLDILMDLVGSAFITVRYAQGYPDSLAALVNGGIEALQLVLAQIFANLDARIGAIEAGFRKGFRKIAVEDLTIINRLDRYDREGNTHLEGEGAPNVLADRVGQRWLDTAANEWWTAYGVTAISQWKKDTN